MGIQDEMKADDVMKNPLQLLICLYIYRAAEEADCMEYQEIIHTTLLQI